VVSKAEGRLFDLEDFPAGPRAREIASTLEAATGEEKDPRFAQAVLEESVDLLMESPFLLTETRFGHVGVNAGIDRSNVPDHDLLLLPKRPSESAERIRAELPADRVVVTDTCGRPFRHGQRGVAIGWAGMHASRDWRGETDRDGRELGVTVESVVDELAAAANLLAGEGAGGTPVVVVRDFEWGDHGGSDNHFREIAGDFVRQAVRGWEHE
jgi:coenzyme F420-0:L-glutamate ligase/coenzyme F420-1:gamma-L-glutamate ligase